MSDDEVHFPRFEGFSRWACCMCVVKFDLELGQAMEVSLKSTKCPLFNCACACACECACEYVETFYVLPLIVDAMSFPAAVRLS